MSRKTVKVKKKDLETLLLLIEELQRGETELMLHKLYGLETAVRDMLGGKEPQYCKICLRIAEENRAALEALRAKKSE